MQVLVELVVAVVAVAVVVVKVDDVVTVVEIDVVLGRGIWISPCTTPSTT